MAKKSGLLVVKRRIRCKRVKRKKSDWEEVKIKVKNSQSQRLNLAKLNKNLFKHKNKKKTRLSRLRQKVVLLAD